MWLFLNPACNRNCSSETNWQTTRPHYSVWQPKVLVLSGASIASSRYPRTVTHYGLAWFLPHFLPGGWTKLVWYKIPSLPEGSWEKYHTQGSLPGAAQGPRAAGPRPEGSSRQGPEGMVFFPGARGQGRDFVIINWQDGFFYSNFPAHAFLLPMWFW